MNLFDYTVEPINDLLIPDSLVIIPTLSIFRIPVINQLNFEISELCYR